MELDNTGTDGTGANIVVGSVLGFKFVESVQIGVTTFRGTELVKTKDTITGITSTPHEIANGESVILSGISTADFTEFNGVRKVSVITRTSGLL